MSNFARRSLAVSCALAIVLATDLVGSAAARTWTDASGRHTLEAELVKVENGQVFLKRESGKVVEMPLARLSQADIDFVSSPVAKPTAATAPASALSGVFTDVKEGPCTLKEVRAFSKDAFTVQVGQKIKGTCTFSISDFFHAKIINACCVVQNTGDKPRYCQYYVAFFDKSGKLVGCAGQGIDDAGLAPSEHPTTLGSCLIPLPLGTHETVASYKVTFYEADVPIGKRAR